MDFILKKLEIREKLKIGLSGKQKMELITVQMLPQLQERFLLIKPVINK